MPSIKMHIIKKLHIVEQDLLTFYNKESLWRYIIKIKHS